MSKSSALRQRVLQLLETNYGTFRGCVRVTLAQLEFIAGRLEAFLHPELRHVQRLVFVCLGNINRSAFAAESARMLNVKACSIGLSTTTGSPASLKAVHHAPGWGVDLAEHLATDISDYEYQEGDLLLVMEIRHAKQLLAQGISERSIALLGHWASPHRIHLHDPHTLSDAYFRSCFSLIHSAVINLSADLSSAASPSVHR